MTLLLPPATLGWDTLYTVSPKGSKTSRGHLVDLKAVYPANACFIVSGETIELKLHTMLTLNLNQVSAINNKVTNLNVIDTTELGFYCFGLSSFNHRLDFLNPNLAR
jgi:hypothetical protein